MKREGTLIVVSVLVVLGLLLGGFGCAPAPPEEEIAPPPEEEVAPPEEEVEVFELSLACSHPYEDPINCVINEAWFNWLERESGGRIKFTLYHSAQAATPADAYDAARMGIVDIACQAYMFVPGRFTLSEVIKLPLIFDFPGSRATALTQHALYEKYPEIQAQFPDVKIINFHATGLAQVHTRDKPIHTMEDLRGQLIVSMGTYPIDTFKALGATPEFIDLPELYDALAKGVVDGAGFNWQAMPIFHWDEVTNYSTEANLCMDAFLHAMNLDTWNSLPPDLQELFVGENALRLSELYGYRFDQDSLSAKEWLNEQYVARGYPEIYVLPEDEKARWKEAVLPVWEKWITDAAALVGETTARAILEDARLFAKQYAYETTPLEQCWQTLHEWGAPGYE